MAKLSKAEREEAQRVNNLAAQYGTLRSDVEKFASMRVFEVREAFELGDSPEAKQIGRLLAVANEVTYKRERLQKDMQYLSERLLDDAKRLGKGREADDVTRNSAFTSLAGDVALFNYRLQQICAQCEDAGIIVAELHPHLSKEQLIDIVKRAQNLIDNMNNMSITEHTVHESREAFISVQRSLWK